MKTTKPNKIQKIILGSMGIFLLVLFLFIHSPVNIFAGFFLSNWTPHLKALPLLEFGLPLDRDGIPIYRSPLHMEGHYDQDPYIDTIFAKGFTPEKFEQIEVGMPKDKVILLVGEPLTHDAFGIRNSEDIHQIVMPDDPRVQDCWRYSSDGKLAGNGDASWYSFLICFKDDIVLEKQANEFSD